MQIAFVIWGQTPWLSYALSSASMVLVTVGTFIAGRYVFRDGFAHAGWKLGKPVHYLAVLALALLAWAAPVGVELALGLHSVPAGVTLGGILTAFLLRFCGTLIPGFGEEFGWRGYMLRHLAATRTIRRALLLQGVIWWGWHLPTLIGLGAQTAASTAAADVAIAVAFTLLVSLIPATLHAVIFAYIWVRSQSLLVASVYHAAFDEVRDALERSVGFGPLVDLWQMLLLTLLGAALLWKGNWQGLKDDRTTIA